MATSRTLLFLITVIKKKSGQYFITSSLCMVEIYQQMFNQIVLTEMT